MGSVDVARGERIAGERVVEVIEEWRRAGGKVDSLPASTARACRRLLTGAQTSIGVDALDRLLVELDLPHLLADLAPLERRGRAGYTWPKPHPLRRLTAEQVKAAHLLHIDGGLSIRELGRQLYERCGYSSPKSCSMALVDAFRRDGLQSRDRIDAVHASNDARGYVRGRTKNERRRQLRAELRATDPAFRADELARLELLHARG